MAIAKRLLKNRNVIMVVGLVAGLVLPQAVRFTEWTILPALALVMTISTMGVRADAFKSAKGLIGAAGLGLALNYGVQIIVLLGLAHLLVNNEVLRQGFVILAAVPPAVAVIPFSFFLGGDRSLSLMGTVGGYLGALVLAPLITVVLIGTGFVSPLRLLVTLLELVVGPLVLAQLLVRTGWAAKMDRFKGPLTNWSFFLINYTMVGLNREIFLHQWQMLLPVLLIGLASTFGTGLVVERLGRAFKVKEEKIISLVLLSVFKNYGLAGGLALFFFNETTAVPATAISVIGILYFVWLEMRMKRKVRL